jgi:hypothetical protein
VREILAQRLEHKHHRVVPEVGPFAVAHWCSCVVCLWKIFIASSPETAAEGGTMPDSSMAFIMGCLYGMAEGLTYPKTGCVLIPPDPDLAAALPPPQDLTALGVAQRTKSNGQKLLHRLLNDRVLSIGSAEAVRDEIVTKLSECRK